LNFTFKGSNINTLPPHLFL